MGELGWELLAPTEFALGVYEALQDAGRAFDLKLAGFHALNCTDSSVEGERP